MKAAGKEERYKEDVNNQLDLMQLLLKKGANPMAGTGFGMIVDILMVEPLLKEGTLDRFLESFFEKIPNEDVSNNEKLRGLMFELFAAQHIGRERRLKMIEMLIKKGVGLKDKNGDGKTLAHQAALGGNDELLTKYVVNDYKESINQPDNSGYTPLHLASSKSVAQVLIQNGAQVDAQDATGATPLHRACNKEIAECLIENKAGVDTKDKLGNTPLHKFLEKPELVQVLISHGAKVNLTNNQKETPLDRALSFLLATNAEKIDEIEKSIKLLLDNGAHTQSAVATLEKNKERLGWSGWDEVYREKLKKIAAVIKGIPLKEEVKTHPTKEEIKTQPIKEEVKTQPTVVDNGSLSSNKDDEENEKSSMVPLAIAGTIFAIVAVLGIKKYISYQSDKDKEETPIPRAVDVNN